MMNPSQRGHLWDIWDMSSAATRNLHELGRSETQKANKRLTKDSIASRSLCASKAPETYQESGHRERILQQAVLLRKGTLWGQWRHFSNAPEISQMRHEKVLKTIGITKGSNGLQQPDINPTNPTDDLVAMEPDINPTNGTWARWRLKLDINMNPSNPLQRETTKGRKWVTTNQMGSALGND